MSARSRKVAAAVVAVLLVALGAAFAVAALHRPGSTAVHVPREATVVKSLSPEDPQFGDTVTATIDVFVDLRRVELRSVTVDGAFTPFRVASSERKTRREGSVGIVHVEHRLRCLDASCVPAADRATVRFTPLLVGYQSGSRSEILVSRWPQLQLHARVAQKNVKKPFFRVGAPQASGGGYRLPPRTTGFFLLAVAALLALGGAAMLVRAIAGGLRPRDRRRDAPLERILRELAAVSSNGDSGRRRRALEELARELEPLDGSLSAESRVLAWAPTDPKQETIAELTSRVAAAVKR